MENTIIATGDNINGQDVVIVEPTGKTIREWLNELPDGYREQALENHGRYYIPGESNSVQMNMQDAICYGFGWDRTPQGSHYWNRICMFYQVNTPLPKLWQPAPYTPTVEDAISEMGQRITSMQADIAIILALLKPKPIDPNLHTID